MSVVPNALEKYMAFTINKNLVFIDSMQFMNSSLDSLVKNLSDNDFKYLPEEFSAKLSKEKEYIFMKIWTVLKGFLKIKNALVKKTSKELIIFAMCLK